MERLTKRTPEGYPYLAKVKDNEQEIDSPHKDTLQCVLDSWGRLAAYEDSGLTPERVAELAAAERDGRLIICPVVLGDTVYLIVAMDCKSGECPDVDTEICQYSRFNSPTTEVFKCRDEHAFIEEIEVEELSVTACIDGFVISINDCYVVGAEDIFSSYDEAKDTLERRKS